MANKKQQKKFPTKVTKKDKKGFKPFLNTQKNLKRVLKYSVTKKVYNLSGKKNNQKKGFLN